MIQPSTFIACINALEAAIMRAALDSNTMQKRRYEAALADLKHDRLTMRHRDVCNERSFRAKLRNRA